MKNEELLAYYNEYFSFLKEYQLAVPFVLEEKRDEETNEITSIKFVGKITSKLAKLPLDIDVKIPLGFPNEKISLTTTSLKGYAHLISNSDDSCWFCLNTPFGETIDEQLNLEIERLSGWIDKYLNNEEPHESTPPSAYRNTKFQLLYNVEDIKLNDVCWGIADCYGQGNNYYPINLGNNPIELNDTFKSTNVFVGKKLFWFFTNTPPMKSDGVLPNNIFDLNKFVPIPKELDKAFKEEYDISLIESSSVGIMGPMKRVSFSDLSKEEQERFNRIPTEEEYWEEQAAEYEREQAQNEFYTKYKDAFLAIGFCFNDEVIWEFAKITPSIETGDKYPNIKWYKSTNIDYKNYFGRGHFCEQITNAKIAIIGVGAIGSSLATILTRGGAKNITLIDDDVVEQGNICRSAFYFTEVGGSKVQELAGTLSQISPYVKIQTLKENIYSAVNYKSKKEINNIFDNTDIIFDCTASNELLHCLSTLDLKQPVISLCITNEARDMICITNCSDNIFEKRKFYLSQLEHDTENLYYEGIGCYTPTFRANYADINSMLNLAVRHINKSFSEKNSVDSFILSHTENGIERNDIVTLHQKELDFTLSVSQQCLNEIRNFAEKHLPYEFGGYLMGGYSRNRKHIYLTNILIAEQNQNGRAFFQITNNDSVHKSISDIFEKTKGMINYIGEWHSHPSMSNHYSSTDFDSIKKQALSEKIYTNNPLMCIVSIDKSHFEPKFYIYYDNKLFSFKENPNQ